MKISKNKEGWEQHIGIRFPSYQFWGLLTIILMLASLKNYTDGLYVLIQLSSTLFLLDGIIKTWKSRRIINEP